MKHNLQICMLILFCYITACSPKLEKYPGKTEANQEFLLTACKIPLNFHGKHLCTDQFMKICQLISDGKIFKAKELCEEIQSQIPLCSNVEWLLIHLEIEFKEYEETLMHIHNISKSDILMTQDASQRFDLLCDTVHQQILMKAQRLIENQKPNEAITVLNNLHTYLPPTEASLNILTKLLFDAGRFKDVIALLEPFVDQNPNPELMKRLGRSYLAIGKNAKAEITMVHTLKNYNDDEIRSIYFQAKSLRLKEHLPASIAKLDTAPWITREDIAGFIVHQFNFWENPSETPIILDLDDSTFKDAILIVVRQNIMHIGRDYKFRPKAKIHKIDLAAICSRILKSYNIDVIGYHGLVPVDIDPEHYAYSSITTCLALGLLDLETDGTFRGSTLPDGETAIRAIKKLAAYIDNYLLNEALNYE